MKLRLLLAGIVLGAAGSAFAHAHLEEASPADGSVLHAPPRQLVLRFSEAAQLTSLILVRDDGSAQKISPLPETAQARITIALPALDPGRYRVSFRVLSADGHVVNGALHFALTR
jgi:methionine-rich copper-binding protein CopC